MGVYDITGSAISYAYDGDGVEVDAAYDLAGNQIYIKGRPYPTSLTQLHSQAIATGQSCQGMATYGGYIFQFFSSVDKMKIYNQSDYSLVNEMDCTFIGHGNSFQFGDEVQANGFPLLYATEGTNMYVVSVDLESISLADTVTLPSGVGYSTNAVINFDDREIYTVGYTASSVYDETGKYVFCVIDFDNPTEVLDTWQEDYLGVMQGLVWNGTHVILNTNTYSGRDVKFYFINPTTKSIDYVYEQAKALNSEYQGFSDEGDYYLVSKWIYLDVDSVSTLFYQFFDLS